MPEKIRVCIIGTGRAGMIHALNFKTSVPNSKIVAVCDPVAQSREAACKSLDVDKSFSDFTQVAKCDEIDAVVIATPTQLHKDIVLCCAKAGKHILCEKPMAMTEQECDEMIEAAKANKVNLQIGFMRRYDESYRQAKMQVDRGDIGDVVLIKSNTRGPSIPKPWMCDIKISNGPLAEVNSHDIDVLRWFSGSDFKSVYAIGGNYRCLNVKDEFPDFYDNVILCASFKNGMQGMIDGAQGVLYGYDARAEILGTKGCIYIGGMNKNNVTVCSVDKGLSGVAVQSWRNLFSEAYLNEDISFINSIINKTEPETTGYDGKMAVKVVEAGNKSIVQKKIIEL